MKNNQRRWDLIETLQEPIAEIKKEIEKLNQDKILYHWIIEEITGKSLEDSSEGSESDISIEIFKDSKAETEQGSYRKTEENLKGRTTGSFWES